MADLREVLAGIRKGGLAATAPASNPFRLGSAVSEPADELAVRSAWPAMGLPDDVRGLWKECRAARLFEDLDYGQWGLVLLDPDASARRTARERNDRPSEFSPDDVVIGEFLGDQDLLVVAPSEVGERRVLVALPLDGRSDWHGAGTDLATFLERYVSAGGEKFWERRS